MAKLYIKRHPDGTISLRGERVQGKQLLGHAVQKGIKREGLSPAVIELWAKVAPARETPPVVSGSIGLGGIA